MPAGPREVTLIRRCYARHNAGDHLAWVAVFHPEMKMVSERVGFFEAGEWNGVDAVRRQFTSYFKSFSDFRFLVHELTALGEWVVADVTVRGRGLRSGIELENRSFALYRFDERRVTEFFVVPDRVTAASVARGSVQRR